MRRVNLSQRLPPRALGGMLAALVLLLQGLAAAAPGRGSHSQRSEAKRSSAPSRRPFTPGASFDLDISQLGDVLGTLREDEQPEQLADWAVYGTLVHAGFSGQQLRQVLYDKVPLRDPALEEVVHFDYGAGRRVILDQGVVWLFRPENDPHPAATLARLADQARMELGEIPTTFRLFKYRPEPHDGAIHVTFVRDAPGVELFSADCFGYSERVVRSVPELEAWLATVDDVTHVRLLAGGAVELGGRRFNDSRTSNVDLEDVAALYQAHVEIADSNSHMPDPGATVRAYNRLVEAYNQMAAEYRQTRHLDDAAFRRRVAEVEAQVERWEAASALRPSPPSLTDDSPPDQVRLLRERIDTLTNDWPRLRAELASKPQAPGFSLDPRWDRTALIQDLRSLTELGDAGSLVAEARLLLETTQARGDDESARPAAWMTAHDVDDLFPKDDCCKLPLTPDQRATLQGVIAALRDARTEREQARAMAPLRALVANTYHRPDSDSQAVRVAALLKFADYRDGLQCARYDGQIQGTRVGMTLFYTDLLAKVWASVDYHRSAPMDAVPGLLSVPRMPQVPAIYWEEENRLTATRLWFGPKPEGYAFVPARRAMELSHISTRVYSAGSNPTRPDEETQPSESNRRVIGWWDRHFERLADYEQQFHRQNQIMKWSIITGWLSHEKSLADLSTVRVNHSQRFDRWFATEKDLRYREDVRLLPNTPGPQGTECLERLASYTFPQRGSPTAYIVGGVSLGSEESLTLGPRISEAVPRALRRGGLSFERSTPDTIETFQHTRYQLPRGEPRVEITPPPTAQMRSGGAALDIPKLSTTFRDSANGQMELGVRAEAGELGTLSVKNPRQTPELTYRPGALQRAEEEASALAGVRDPRAARLAELRGTDPWRALAPREGEYLIQGPEGLQAIVRSDSGTFWIKDSTGGLHPERGTFSSKGSVGTDPLSPLLKKEPPLTATPIPTERADALLGEMRVQKLTVHEGGELTRVFTKDGPPPGSEPVTAKLPIPTEGLKIVAHQGALYLERGSMAPEDFADFVTNAKLSGKDVEVAVSKGVLEPSAALGDRAARAARAALRDGSRADITELLTHPDGHPPHELLAIVAANQVEGHDAQVLQDFARAREELPQDLAKRTRLERKKFVTHTSLDVEGLPRQQLSPEEHSPEGIDYVLQPQDGDAAPGPTVSKVAAKEPSDYQKLDDSVAREFQEKAGVLPEEITDGHDRYVRTTHWQWKAPAARTTSGCDTSGDNRAEGPDRKRKENCPPAATSAIDAAESRDVLPVYLVRPRRSAPARSPSPEVTPCEL